MKYTLIVNSESIMAFENLNLVQDDINNYYGKEIKGSVGNNFTWEFKENKEIKDAQNKH